VRGAHPREWGWFHKQRSCPPLNLFRFKVKQPSFDTTTPLPFVNTGLKPHRDILAGFDKKMRWRVKRQELHRHLVARLQLELDVLRIRTHAALIDNKQVPAF